MFFQEAHWGAQGFVPSSRRRAPAAQVTVVTKSWSSEHPAYWYALLEHSVVYQECDLRFKLHHQNIKSTSLLEALARKVTRFPESAVRRCVFLLCLDYLLLSLAVLLLLGIALARLMLCFFLHNFLYTPLPLKPSSPFALSSKNFLLLKAISKTLPPDFCYD